MRGKPSIKDLVTRLQRITPADAGKTFKKFVKSSFDRDHPRGCGENPMVCILMHSSIGITPADAGKTVLYNCEYGGSRDHPRGCGENPKRVSLRRVLAGSPPRMRGKRYPIYDESYRNRITPADAGKTRWGVKHFEVI